MASQAQIEANRKNARKSTGPKTESGKSVAKLNAVKHGLTAEHVVVPGEDPAELEELRRELDQELEPMGRQESDLIETITMGMWRRRRIYRMEADILAYEQAEKELKLAERDKLDRATDLNRYYDHIEWVREHGEDPEDEEYDEEDGQEEDGQEEDDEGIEKSNKYQAAAIRFDNTKQNSEELSTHLGAFFLGSPRYPNALERILRYEAAIDRSLGRAQDQLARLQRERHDKAASHATVIDSEMEPEEASG